MNRLTFYSDVPNFCYSSGNLANSRIPKQTRRLLYPSFTFCPEGSIDVDNANKTFQQLIALRRPLNETILDLGHNVISDGSVM